jgi:hypothetical protein
MLVRQGRLDLSDVVVFGILGRWWPTRSAYDPDVWPGHHYKGCERSILGEQKTSIPEMGFASQQDLVHLVGIKNPKKERRVSARRGARDEHGARVAAGTYKADARKETVLEDFTPISGLIGGLLIGLSTALLLLLNGRIAGISGIIGGLLSRQGSKVGWRAVFAVGLLLGAFVYMLATGDGVPVEIEASLPILVVAGLLVGFGARLGSGCTSGHGLSGIARFSKRSVVATLVFMGVAMLTVFLSNHVL